MLRRILAIAGVVLLAGLYIATLVAAIMGVEKWHTLFWVSLWGTVVVPIAIHLALILENVRKGKRVLDEPYSYRENKS